MKKQNIFLKSILVVASVCALTPNRVQANNTNLAQTACKVIIGTTAGVLAAMATNCSLKIAQAGVKRLSGKNQGTRFDLDEILMPKETDSLFIALISIMTGAAACCSTIEAISTQ